MSYDLTARSDPTFSCSIQRSEVASVAAQLPNVEPNGPAGFLLERDGDVWMEIDVELVSEEGDNIEDTGTKLSMEANCINFHVPYAFAENLSSHYEVALRIADAVGWQLYDPQTDEVVLAQRRRKPWWRFWECQSSLTS